MEACHSVTTGGCISLNRNARSYVAEQDYAPDQQRIQELEARINNFDIAIYFTGYIGQYRMHISSSASAMSLSPELTTLLEKSRWPATLTADQMDRLRHDIYEKSFPSGAIIYPRGTPADHWFGLIEGMIKVDTVAQDGRSTTFAGVPSGSWFGEGAVLKNEPRPYSIVAIRDSKLAFVPKQTFEWLLQQSTSFSRFVIDQLNWRCGYYVALVENRRLREASARVAFCLSELFNPQLYPSTEQTLPLSQEEIGRLSGLSRQNTNKALRELADMKLLSVEYGSVVILDLPRLRKFAHHDE
ncbi:Crp/Fnr family transcriptional regulator [Herbaspirillum chlorophenolicum]|uniref:Crp/Fnr family transcriptional regulator n=1 Tax=Herbaspirillum chlorophenolicum TaxID=211589 RepID=A0ABW8EZK9_9BURK